MKWSYFQAEKKLLMTFVSIAPSLGVPGGSSWMTSGLPQWLTDGIKGWRKVSVTKLEALHELIEASSAGREKLAKWKSVYRIGGIGGQGGVRGGYPPWRKYFMTPLKKIWPPLKNEGPPLPKIWAETWLFCWWRHQNLRFLLTYKKNFCRLSPA